MSRGSEKEHEIKRVSFTQQEGEFQGEEAGIEKEPSRKKRKHDE